jgi:hypothetical protein
MVASALGRRVLWLVLALSAAGFISVVSMHGERPEAGLQRFEPGGFLAGHRPQDVRGITIKAADRLWRYDRSAHGVWSSVSPPTTVTPERGQRIEQALDLLRNAKPERRFTREEATAMDPADLGLASSAMIVSVLSVDGTRFSIAFGAENPLGHARYARLEGQDSLWLVPRHVVDSWNIVISQP